MQENKYDNPVFFEKYSQMSRSREGLSGAGEWETLKDLLPDFAGKRVLDLGCGSGILSLCALLLGAKSATGVDIDALAVKTAVENGRENGFSAPRFTVLQGDLTEQVKGRCDIVVANIVADVIIRFCKDVRQFMKPGAVFITSGIIDTREEDILAAFAQYGFTIQERHEDGGWVCFVCTA